MKSRQKIVRKNEKGYALLLVMFFIALMVLATIAIAPKIRTDARREKEIEMIWRGNQYKRGIKLYYRKTGKFPTSLDDLTKPKMGQIRFMRKEYKDPMNTKDGTWRLIYVGPTGQLIGSLKPQPSLQLPGSAGQMGTPVSAMGNLNGQSQNSFGNGMNSGSSFSSGSSFGTPASQMNSSQNGQPVLDANGVPTDTDVAGNPVAMSDFSDNTIIGGNIIGVGSKASDRSIIVYEKAKNYRLFEFYWNPAEDQITVGAPGAAPQQGTFGQPVNQNSNPMSNPGSMNPSNPGTMTPPQNPTENPPQEENPQQ